VYRVLLVKLEGKRPIERQKRRWEDGIKMDLREIGWGGVEWIQLASFVLYLEDGSDKFLRNTANDLKFLQ
jgi:hypothetical protein